MTEPVLIVGAGPTGLTAALELARFGIPVRIVDKRAEPADTSRAVGVQARTLELLDRRGLAADLVRRGNPAAGGSIYGGGRRLVHLDLAGLDSPFPFLLVVSQVETERVLREAVARLGVAVEWGVELAGLAQDAHSPGPTPARAILRRADGSLGAAEVAYLIAAEGAHSVARGTLDLDFAGETFAEGYALGDLHLDGDLPIDSFHVFASEHGLVALFPLAAGHFRLIVGNPIGRPGRGAGPTLAELQAAYDQRSHIPARFRDLTWSSWFRINSRMVGRLRVGRLFLGGDSAHIHSPAGGQGMNTGIQDMINLGWKLALVLKGQAPPALLDTYDQDRLPVIRHVLDVTEKLTGMVGSGDPIVRALLGTLGPWVGGAEFVQQHAAAQMSQVAVGYRSSPLSAHHAAGAGLHAGDRLPDLPARTRDAAGGPWRDETLFARLDPSRFLLLVAGAGEGAEFAGAIAAALRPWGDLIRVVEAAPAPAGRDPGRFAAAFGRAAGLFLVRPDGYVGFADDGPSAPRHLDDYCRRWLAAAPAAPRPD